MRKIDALRLAWAALSGLQQWLVVLVAFTVVILGFVGIRVSETQVIQSVSLALLALGVAVLVAIAFFWGAALWLGSESHEVPAEARHQAAAESHTRIDHAGVAWIFDSAREVVDGPLCPVDSTRLRREWLWFMVEPVTDEHRMSPFSHLSCANCRRHYWLEKDIPGRKISEFKSEVLDRVRASRSDSAAST